jgi:hypothetical protein
LLVVNKAPEYAVIPQPGGKEVNCSGFEGFRLGDEFQKLLKNGYKT